MENLEPKTRLEQFLSAIAGNDIELPEVKTRLEYWLKEIAENGGESGGGGGSSGGGGIVIRIADEPMETIPEWLAPIPNLTAVYETNVTYSEVKSALTSSPIAIYQPTSYTGEEYPRQGTGSIQDQGAGPGPDGSDLYSVVVFPSQGKMAPLVSNGMTGPLYLIKIQDM